jgi:hypothetical protein
MARFRFQPSLESFDVKFQPSIEPKAIKDLASGRFIVDADNVLLLGLPGAAHSFRVVFIIADPVMRGRRLKPSLHLLGDQGHERASQLP